MFSRRIPVSALLRSLLSLTVLGCGTSAPSPGAGRKPIASMNGSQSRQPVAVAVAAGASSSPDADFVLSAGRAGLIEGGATVDEVYKLVGKERVHLVDLYKESLFSPAIEIALYGQSVSGALVADIDKWPCGEFAVQGIEVRDPRYKTRDGLGVGSTLADVRAKYEIQISEAEGGRTAMVKALKMSFELDEQEPADRARVLSTWIWPDPESVRKRRCPEGK